MGYEVEHWPKRSNQAPDYYNKHREQARPPGPEFQSPEIFKKIENGAAWFDSIEKRVKLMVEDWVNSGQAAPEEIARCERAIYVIHQAAIAVRQAIDPNVPLPKSHEVKDGT